MVASFGAAREALRTPPWPPKLAGWLARPPCMWAPHHVWVPHHVFRSMAIVRYQVSSIMYQVSGIYCLFIAYSFYSLLTHCLFTAYSLLIRAPTAYSLLIWSPTAHPPRIRSLFTAYSLLIRILFSDSEIVMVDGTFWDDSFEQDRSWDDFGTTISGI